MHWYVSTFGGSDGNTGGEGDPFYSIGHAYDTAASGDTLILHGMLDAIKDALTFRKEAYSEASCGVVIVCPKTQTTVSSSYQEWTAQVEEGGDTFQDIKTKLQNHPLVTNCLLAIQGVSRLKRLSAMGHAMDSEVFKNGQVSH
jgi:hypothetical protein